MANVYGKSGRFFAAADGFRRPFVRYTVRIHNRLLLVCVIVCRPSRALEDIN